MRFAAATLLIALAGCDVQSPKPAEPRATPAAKPAPSPKPTRSPADRLAAAVRAVPAAEEHYVFDGDDRLIDAPFGPVLLRHGHVPDAEAGHGNMGTVAAYYLRPQGDGFALVKAYPEAATAGSMGDLGSWSVSDAFATLPTLRVEGGGTWQGCTVSFAELVELRPGGPAPVASIQTVYDNSGVVEDGAQSVEGTIGDIVKDRGFTVRYKGTESFAERYVRRGDRFVREDGGESRVPGC